MVKNYLSLNQWEVLLSWMCVYINFLNFTRWMILKKPDVLNHMVHIIQLRVVSWTRLQHEADPTEYWSEQVQTSWSSLVLNTQAARCFCEQWSKFGSDWWRMSSLTLEGEKEAKKEDIVLNLTWKGLWPHGMIWSLARPLGLKCSR